MKFKDFWGTKKGKIVTLSSGAAVAAVGIAVAIAIQGAGFRSIVVDQANGQVNVSGEKNNGPAYQGEKLFTGDQVAVGASSNMVMCMDLDKYVYADANTNFGIESSSTRDDSRMKLYLTAGSELNELRSKLGPNDSYEVDTPNSTMAVRGTTFRCTVYYEDGLVYTLLEVKEGAVHVRLKTSDGTYNGVEHTFYAGESALIRGNSDFSEFVVGEEDEIVLILNYPILPEPAVDRLIELLVHMQDKVIVGDVEAQEASADADNDISGQSAGGSESGDGSGLSNGGSAGGGDSGSGDGSLNASGSGDNADGGAGSGNTDASDNGSGTGAGSTPSPTPTPTPKHSHTSSDWTVINAATCQADGLEQRICTDCQEVLEKRVIPMTTHVPGEWLPYSWPTCTAEGGETQNCIYCNKVLNSRPIPATGHTYSNGYCIYCGEVDPVSYSYSSSDSGNDNNGGSSSGGCTHPNAFWEPNPTGAAGGYWYCPECGARF